SLFGADDDSEDIDLDALIGAPSKARSYDDLSDEDFSISASDDDEFDVFGASSGTGMTGLLGDLDDNLLIEADFSNSVDLLSQLRGYAPETPIADSVLRDEDFLAFAESPGFDTTGSMPVVKLDADEVNDLSFLDDLDDLDDFDAD